MLKNLNKVTRSYTHAGVFHADDVFSTALLQMINGAITIQRVASVDKIEDDDETIIFDIGLGRYDHHQKDKATRPMEDGYWINKANGEVLPIPYCSFGLLWRDYGRLLCPKEKAWKKVDTTLVLPIDKADNGISFNTLASAIGQLNPAWNSNVVPMVQFNRAVDMAALLLKNYVQRANAEADAESLILSSRVVADCILVLDQYMPWSTTVVEQMPNILFTVYPSNRGGFSVQTVPVAEGSTDKRMLFPVKWLGNPDASLGMTFCHPGNFILSCETQEQAIHCAMIAAGKENAA